jgi:hypothetical protein
MSHPRQSIETPSDDDIELPDDLIESIEDSSDDDYGDETQANEERTAEEGIEQDDLIDPRGEDEREDDVDE